MQQPRSRDQPDALSPILNDRALTGLRGIAALMVVTHHYALLDLPSRPLWPDLYRGMYLAVDLFFVLSGYVMALAYAHWFTPGRASLLLYAEFVLRRLARLWPLHAVMTLALLASHYLSGQWTAWPKLIATNLLLVQAWGVSQSLNPPSWSISTELAAYLLFPGLVAAALHGPRVRAWLMAGLAAALLAVAVTLVPDGTQGRRGMLDIHMNWSVLPLLRCLGGFITGLLLFRVVRSPVMLRFIALPWTGPATAILIVGMMGFRVPDLLIYPLLPLLIAALHRGRGRFPGWLASPLPHQVGVLSYALYLVHYPLLAAVPWQLLPRELGYASAVALSLAAAYLAHKLIELPGRPAVMWLGGPLRRPVPTH